MGESLLHVSRTCAAQAPPNDTALAAWHRSPAAAAIEAQAETTGRNASVEMELPSRDRLRKWLKGKVGATGIEPMTSTVSR